MPAHIRQVMCNPAHVDDIGLHRHHECCFLRTIEKPQSKKRSRSTGYLTSSIMNDSFHSASSGGSSSSWSVQEREPSVDKYSSIDIVKKATVIETSQEFNEKESNRNDGVSPQPPIDFIPVPNSILNDCDTAADGESCQSSVVSDITEHPWILDALEAMLLQQVLHMEQEEDEHVPPPVEIIYIAENISGDVISVFDDATLVLEEDDDDDEIDVDDDASFDVLDVVLLTLKVSVTVVLLQQLHRCELPFPSTMTLWKMVVTVLDEESLILNGLLSLLSAAVAYGCFIFLGYRPTVVSSFV